MDEVGVHEDGGTEGATARSRVEIDWPLRPWIFAGLLALAGLAIYFLTDEAGDSGPRLAAAAFIAFACGAFVFTAERGRLLAPAIFSIVTGLVVGGLTWRAVGAGNDVADGGYALAAGFFACLLAVPLFQADVHRRWFRTDYKDIHYFVWTDAITAAGAFIFFLIAWLLIWLVAALLDLVGIPLRDLVETGWFTAMYAGLTVGAGLGTLRNQLKIIGTLQSVVLLVLSILALPLAFAIMVFLGAVVVSGPSVLWDATDSATPVLLAIAIGAYVLANAVLRDRDADMVGGAALKWSGYALALGILPLTVFAAISTGVRIDQHGLSPERLWALASVGVAVAFGLAYFVDALVGARGSWGERLRASNLRLAMATAIFALFLALPMLNFGTIATSDQLARLKSGAISVEEFDFSALRWDFGEPGRNALARLVKSTDEAIAQGARRAQLQESRPYRWHREAPQPDEVKIAWQGGEKTVHMAIEAYLAANGAYCGREERCTAILADEVSDGAPLFVVTNGDMTQYYGVNAQGEVEEYFVQNGRLVSREQSNQFVLNAKENKEPPTNVELRPFEGRQLYVDGAPVGQPFK
ncbi:DUF4153 domain-containing protein [Alteriqipengyuania lutimaris]|uniref:DUF4153 domain-containing protein n=1 Tax=Alteriqipengyuania lutimaris TaxID=1538146 RepID=A0A395LKP5_9SPHN|nr:DUF4153 domain-containing protein [Alteriqipengyuania lutimaris]MBB3033473.1 hypothetical protein [Alteriqipengyuania lutimaris]RDS77512.1 DUF4153 domain-containing protein [Alteriqipengyuania lutimaris]